MKLARGTAILLVALGLGILAAPASAAQKPPPDNSAVDEYTESVPGAGGNTPSSEVRGGSGGGPGKSDSGAALPPSTVAELDSYGADGQAAAALAEAGSPRAARNHAGGKEGGGKSGGNKTEDRGGNSGVGDVVGQLVGSSDAGGMGLLLPLILLGTLLAVGLAVIVAHRRGSEPAG